MKTLEVTLPEDVASKLQEPAQKLGVSPEDLVRMSLITVSEALYERLEAEARRRGIESVEALLEVWQNQQDDVKERHEAVRQIDALRERLLTKYGEMPDSVRLVQEDRARP